MNIVDQNVQILSTKTVLSFLTLKLIISSYAPFRFTGTPNLKLFYKKEIGKPGNTSGNPLESCKESQEFRQNKVVPVLWVTL
jgi:hypothetical protein